MQRNVPKGGQPNRATGKPYRRPMENEKINRIMKDDGDIEQTIKRNPSFNKRDRLYEFQADFEKKMERMNKELQNEIEAETEELRRSELSNTHREHGHSKQKAVAKAPVPVKSHTNRDATPPRSVFKTEVQEVQQSPEAKVVSQQVFVPPLNFKAQMSQIRRERIVHHKAQDSIDSGAIVEVNSEDWLDIAKSNDNGDEEFRETETFRKLDTNEELIRLYTPPA